MNPPAAPDELHVLLDAFSDGTLDPAGLARLEERLARDPYARRDWFLHCDLENGLADWAAARGERDAPGWAPSLPPRRKPRPLWLGLALAAGLLVAAGLGLRGWRGPPSETPSTCVAVLTRAVGAQWVDGAVFRPGVALEPATLRLHTGLVLLDFVSGARVVLEGPAELELQEAGRVHLLRGTLTAQVPAQARGFTVDLPGARVVDLGTRFGVAVPEQGPPEVHVFEGLVEVTPAGGAAVPLKTGQALRLDPSGPSALNSHRNFANEGDLHERNLVEALRREEGGRRASRALSADPATLLHFWADEETDRTLPNLARRAQAPGPGIIVGTDWADSRLIGHPTLAFRSDADRVRLEVTETFSALTLLAWVRVEALPRWHNALIASEADAPGSLRWYLTQRGELRLEIARDLGRASRDWEAVNSRPFLRETELGRWILLASTFDGSLIRHYANGEPVGEGASFTPPALRLGGADLANWRGPTQRHLAADLDEFALLTRSMSPAEIRAFARAAEAGEDASVPDVPARSCP